MCCQKMETIHQSKCQPDIKIVLVQLFILLTFCLEIHAVSECTKLTVFYENKELNDTSSVCVKKYAKLECLNFSRSFDHSQLPEGFPKWEGSTEAPRDINVLRTNYYYGDCVYAGMLVKFNSPLPEVGQTHILGYLLVWQDDIEDRCRLFQINNRSELLTSELRYEYNISKVRDPANFTVKVYTLLSDTPDKLTNKLKYIEMGVIVPQVTQAGPQCAIDPADWAPLLAYQIFDNGSIDVKFTLSPSSMNLTLFDVSLENETGIIDSRSDYRPGIYSEESPQGFVKFNVSTSGTYRIKILVLDEDHMKLGKCRCWKYEGNNKICQTTCGSIASKFFSLNVTRPVLPTPPDEDNIGETLTLSLTLAGSLGAATVLIVLAIIICWKYKEEVKRCLFNSLRSEGSKKPAPTLLVPGVDPESSPIRVDPLRKKVIYLISTEDHEAHKELVECFVNFLQIHCYCQVITPSNCDTDRVSRFEWFISSVNKADYIIFVDSQGAKSMIMAHLKIILTRVAPDEFFLYGLKHLLMNQEARENKLVLVSFQRNHCQTYLQASTIYTFPEHLPEFLQKIHKISAKNSKAYDKWLPMYTENISNLSEGQQLLSAITFAKNYEKNNPDWINNKFGPALNSVDSSCHSTLSSSHALSVSTMNVTLSETASPVLVFEEPNFASYLNSPIGTSCGLTEHVEAIPGFLLENCDEGTSWVTVPHSQFTQRHEEQEKDGTEQERILFDVISFVPPESASVMNVESFSTALNNINNNNEESRSECPQHVTSQPGNFCHDLADVKLNEKEFQAGLVPPDNLSNIKMEESISRALANINADSDTVLLGGSSISLI